LSGKIWQFPAVAAVSTDNPSTESLIHITALGVNFEITISLNLQDMKLENSRKTP
jgi:hypothetical protein